MPIRLTKVTRDPRVRSSRHIKSARHAALVAALALGGCVTHPQPAPHLVISVESQPEAGWRTLANTADQAAVDRLATSWTEARSRAASRFPTRLRQEGPLLDLAAALPQPAMPPGPYHCRLVRLGGQAGYASYRPDFCFIMSDGEAVSLTKQAGQTLPGGWLYADENKKRLIFLGTDRVRSGDSAPAYGSVPTRTVIGLVERIADFRWRLVIARRATPGAEAGVMDIYDMTPVVVEPQQAMRPTVHEIGMRVPSTTHREHSGI